MLINLLDIPVYYINLDEALERRESMERLLKELEFKNVTRVQAVQKYHPVGCATSHYLLLSQLTPPFIILEDDLLLETFNPELNIPEDADAVYLGISMWGMLNGSAIEEGTKWDPVADNIVRTYNMLSTHAILYLSPRYVSACSLSTYKSIEHERHCDIGIAELQHDYKVYACDPPMFSQHAPGTQRPLSNVCPVEGRENYVRPPLPTSSPLVSYCITNYNRSILAGRQYLPKLISDLMADAPEGAELVVTDWLSTDWSLREWLPQAWDKPLQIIDITGDFSLAKGKVVACERSNGKYIFVLDADMVIPQGFTQSIIEKLKDRWTTVFPLYFDEDKEGNIWPTEVEVIKFQEAGEYANRGQGNFMFPRKLWDKLRDGYGSAKTRTIWGGEDHRMFYKACELGEVWRDWFPGFNHRWHPREGSFYDLSSKCPKNVFFYWTGDDPCPLILLLRELIYKHSGHGRNYKAVYLTDENIRDYITIPTHDNVWDWLEPAQKSDYVRAKILYKYGGIWLDSDTVVMDDISGLFDLIDKGEGFLLYEGNSVPVPGVIGTKAGTPLFQEWCERLDRSVGIALGWGELGPQLLNTIVGETDKDKNYHRLDGLDTIYPSSWEYCVADYVELPKHRSSDLERDFQPVVVLVGHVYRALHHLSRRELLEADNPLAYFLNKSMSIPESL